MSALPTASDHETIDGESDPVVASNVIPDGVIAENKSAENHSANRRVGRVPAVRSRAPKRGTRPTFRRGRRGKDRPGWIRRIERLDARNALPATGPRGSPHSMITLPARRRGRGQRKRRLLNWNDAERRRNEDVEKAEVVPVGRACTAPRDDADHEEEEKRNDDVVGTDEVVDTGCSQNDVENEELRINEISWPSEGTKSCL